MFELTITEGPCQSHQADLPAHPKGLLARGGVSANLQHSGGPLQGEYGMFTYMPVTKAKSPTLQPILLEKINSGGFDEGWMQLGERKETSVCLVEPRPKCLKK